MKRLAGLLLITAASVLSWSQAPNCTSLTQQALTMSGVNQEIDVMAQLLASDEYLQQITAGKADGPEFAAVFKPILRKNFDAPTLKKELLSRVATRCKPDQMGQAIQEMQTPFVSRMLQLEAARYTPEGQEKIKKYMSIIKIAPPPDSQLDMADAFDQKAGVTDYSVDSIVAVTRGILQGAGAPDDVLAQFLEHRKQMKAQMQGVMLASILSTYSGVSKPDLMKYGDELSSGPLKWYYDNVHQSFLEVVEQHAQAIGQDLKAAMVAKRG